MVTLVWDSSGIYHPAVADRLDVLAEHAKGPADDPWRNVTTRLVVGEVADKGYAVPTWVEVVDETGEEQVTLADWFDRVGAGRYHRGEASVFNLASSRSWTAVVDDRNARVVGQQYGVETHGILWVIAQPVARGEVSEAAAEGLATALLATGARYPFNPGGYCEWARTNGLLR